MIDLFITYLRNNASLTDGEIDRVVSLSTPRSLRRNELLLQEGQICRQKGFILKGLLYTAGSAAGEDGEHILQFSAEQNWILDAESYDQQIPSRFNIAAVEKTELLVWGRNDFEGLREEIPGLTKFAQQLISRNIYSSRQRILAALSGTPEEKYTSFVRNNPGLLQRLPLRMIASYLGISLKTLTRIRHAQIQR
ncbi:Crp/Fnr family transcriptional regulator [Terrimonas sp. NA20]|uniref:Crp/Fnr family transcriptional regulator n=1 Tax=Terrimonas ginsenosidimutans TaxID=2908004 RepID=A0ABS9L172_9BACT|nr:Crp/Fnr family transcriptional regulator [Terrimonas ginsenosidimutans]MCG2618219.1 Crp/Fnr family transcriptional regulator [Terrimonas ginsenosidimutans]